MNFNLDFNQDDDKSEDEGDNDRTITAGPESKFTGYLRIFVEIIFLN